MNPPSKLVSFRLSADVLEVLDGRCKIARLSRGELCRTLVIAGLVSPNTDDLYAHLRSIEQRVISELAPIQNQSKLLAYLLHAIIISHGKMSREQAVEFVRTEFLLKIGEQR